MEIITMERIALAIITFRVEEFRIIRARPMNGDSHYGIALAVRGRTEKSNSGEKFGVQDYVTWQFHVNEGKRTPVCYWGHYFITPGGIDKKRETVIKALIDWFLRDNSFPLLKKRQEIKEKAIEKMKNGETTTNLIIQDLHPERFMTEDERELLEKEKTIVPRELYNLIFCSSLI